MRHLGSLQTEEMLGLSERKEAEESCLPPTLSLVGIPSEVLTLPDTVLRVFETRAVLYALLS